MKQDQLKLVGLALIQYNIRQNQVLQLCRGPSVMASQWRQEHHFVLPVLLVNLALL